MHTIIHLVQKICLFLVSLPLFRWISWLQPPTAKNEIKSIWWLFSQHAKRTPEAQPGPKTAFYKKNIFPWWNRKQTYFVVVAGTVDFYSVACRSLMVIKSWWNHVAFMLSRQNELVSFATPMFYSVCNTASAHQLSPMLITQWPMLRQNFLHKNQGSHGIGKSGKGMEFNFDSSRPGNGLEFHIVVGKCW